MSNVTIAWQCLSEKIDTVSKQIRVPLHQCFCSTVEGSGKLRHQSLGLVFFAFQRIRWLRSDYLLFFCVQTWIVLGGNKVFSFHKWKKILENSNVQHHTKGYFVTKQISLIKVISRCQN